MVEARALPQAEITRPVQNYPTTHIRSVQPNRRAVNDYLVRYIKMNYEMGRDIGKVLEDLTPFDFTAVKPNLNISFESDAAKKKAEDRQYELDYSIDYMAHKYRVTKYEENLVKAYEVLWDRCSLAMRAMHGHPQKEMFGAQEIFFSHAQKSPGYKRFPAPKKLRNITHWTNWTKNSFFFGNEKITICTQP